MRAQSLIGCSKTQEEAQERLLTGVMHGTVVKLAVHAKGGPLRQAVRMELRCSYSAHHVVLTSPDQQSHISSGLPRLGLTLSCFSILYLRQRVVWQSKCRSCFTKRGKKGY